MALGLCFSDLESSVTSRESSQRLSLLLTRGQRRGCSRFPAHEQAALPPHLEPPASPARLFLNKQLPQSRSAFHVRREGGKPTFIVIESSKNKRVGLGINEFSPLAFHSPCPHFLL